MEVRQSKQGDVMVLGPIGRLDTKTSTDFENIITETLKSGEKRFVIDLSLIEYVSSAGLRVMLMLAKKLPGLDGSLALCGMPDNVKEVFDVAGFTSVFTIAGTEEEALRLVVVDPRKAKLPGIAARLLALRDDTNEGMASPIEARIDPEAMEIINVAAGLLGVDSSRAPAERKAAVTPRSRADIERDSAEAKKDNPWSFSKFLRGAKKE